MNVRKILLVFGTRPEAIKMAPVVTACRARSELDVKICVTAQHRRLLDQVMESFGLTADFDLDVMTPNQTLEDITVRVMRGLEGVFQRWKPDWVLVQGDTTTAFAAALAAVYRRIKVGHVEAGLRTGDVGSPWPEEMNRLLISDLATQHYAPTQRARENLLKENRDPATVFVTGNTVIDALHEAVGMMDGNAELTAKLAARFPFLDPAKRLILVTGHRRENIGDGHVRICKAIRRMALRPDVQIVYPMHLNPRVRGPAGEILGGVANVRLVEPLDYFEFLYLLRKCAFVMTDSGGVQEEAPSLGKPVVVMRGTTERPEAVEAGTAVLAGTRTESLVATAERLLDDPTAYGRMARAVNPYGDGRAAERIAGLVVRHL